MEYKKIGDITSVVTGGTPSTGNATYWENGEIPWLQSGCCQNCDVNSAERYITQKGYDNSSTKLMPSDTVMIALTGATAGKIGYLTFEACGNQSITGILPNMLLNQRYLFYYLLSQRTKILSDCIGGAQPHISQGYVKNMDIPIMSLEEQEKIVNVLSKLMSIITKRRNEIQKLDSLIKARFIEMFGNQEFPIISLDSIAEVTGGLTKNGKRKDMPMKYPYLRVANVYYNRLDLSEILEIGVKDNAEVEKALLKTDDLLFVEGNGSPAQIGRVALWNGSIEHCLHQNHLIKARLELSKVNPRYVLFYFMSEDGREQIANRAVSTSGLYTLSVSKVAGLVLPIPPIELQNEFDEFVKLTDKSKVAVQKALEETKLLFDSLMQEYFG